MIEMLILAWFLQLFGFGTMCVEVFNPMFNLEITLAHYYVLAGLVGLLIWIIKG